MSPRRNLVLVGLLGALLGFLGSKVSSKSYAQSSEERPAKERVPKLPQRGDEDREGELPRGLRIEERGDKIHLIAPERGSRFLVLGGSKSSKGSALVYGERSMEISAKGVQRLQIYEIARSYEWFDGGRSKPCVCNPIPPVPPPIGPWPPRVPWQFQGFLAGPAPRG